MIRGFYTLMSYNCFSNAEDPENVRWAPQVCTFWYEKIGEISEWMLIRQNLLPAYGKPRKWIRWQIDSITELGYYGDGCVIPGEIIA